jgi:hypothetical protein
VARLSASCRTLNHCSSRKSASLLKHSRVIEMTLAGADAASLLITGRMRRVQLSGRENILKRLPTHIAGAEAHREVSRTSQSPISSLSAVGNLRIEASTAVLGPDHVIQPAACKRIGQTPHWIDSIETDTNHSGGIP